MLLAHWHPAGAVTAEPADPPFTTHLHGRDLAVLHEAAHRWHWRVASPRGDVLAEGDATTRVDAERYAEDEATAVHPPSEALLDRLLR